MEDKEGTYISATREAPGVWRGWFQFAGCDYINQLPDTHRTKTAAKNAVKERIV